MFVCLNPISFCSAKGQSTSIARKSRFLSGYGANEKFCQILLCLMPTKKQQNSHRKDFNFKEKMKLDEQAPALRHNLLYWFFNLYS